MNKGARKTVEPSPNSGPLIIGHRGASAHAPENTHAAFELAFESGADGIEFDVRLAGDGVPYIFHDATLERTAGVRREADIHRSTTLSQMYVGQWFLGRHPPTTPVEYARQRIPTLAQVFERYGTHTLYAEMKCEDAARRPALARAVVELIHKHDLAPRVIVKSFALDSLREVKRLAPEVRTAALFGRSWPRPLVPPARIIAEAVDCGADEISLHRSLLRGRTVEAARQLGLEVLVWTVNTPASLRRALKLGLRAVFTDYPGEMRASLARLLAEGAAR
ncbi:MAG TPA: glycerophosphodiester phosphodiesterase [Pyrinomonadaceae bacterium]|nr:glycerophosphodiester phosphodiesterase [Pyrinomonadaceae bacterium]